MAEGSQLQNEIEIRRPAGMPLSLLVDARGLYTSGIGRYLREVLQRVVVDPRFASVSMLGDLALIDRFRGEQGDGADRVRAIPYEHPMYSPAAQVAWRRVHRRARADVTFFPHYDGPIVSMPAGSVVTIHDLIHFKVPAAFPPAKRLFAGVLLRRVVQQAETVIAVSEATRRDLEARFPGCEGKVCTILQGVSPFWQAAASADEREAPTGIPVRFLLCVGNRKPHKNLKAAVETLALLSERAPDLFLVVAGGVFSAWDEVVATSERLGVRDRLVEIEAANDETLRALYRACEAFLFPSYYEGFGLPILEAMACGAPVIASDRSSIPEVAGDAAILIDPDDHRGMAEAVLRLARGSEARDSFVRRGLVRAKTFSWEETAMRTVDQLFRTGSAATAGSGGGR